MVRYLRTKFWIPRIKNLVKSHIQGCKVCIVHRRRLQAQMMGDLSREHITYSRPFTHTGIDFAGPFEIKNYTGPFSRFVALRQCPQRIHSANGKTIVGDTKLNIMKAFPQHILSWQFIPPSVPHMGGLWEAGVKSFKTLLNKSSSTVRYTFEELSTLLWKLQANFSHERGPRGSAGTEPGTLPDWRTALIHCDEEDSGRSYVANQPMAATEGNPACFLPQLKK
ncbi:uncharacterized protein [Drosophila tropicalis]|uniref:uncharacterized protein n=1 Tax=Drosophila tropicalis TaxID=46794 RepID=UPI0035ABE760